MIRWREGNVVAVVRDRRDARELTVATSSGELPALAYPRLVGTPEVGDRVLLNTTAIALGLGTGGFALVVAIPDRLPADRDEPGHVVKARYTPLQATVLAVDEQDSPDYELLRDADSIDKMPVVVADLHSALTPILAGLREGGRSPKAVYVMTDGGALPLGFSRSVEELSDAGWLAATVTVGQAFGGDVEAVTLHTGLLAARHVLGADLAIVTQGPGNLGTGTRWGFSGVASGEAVNATAALGGRPVAALRISEADQRDRHRGVSHHSLTALGRVALAPADVVVPRLEGAIGADVSRAVRPLSPPHRLVSVETGGLRDAVAAAPGRVSTMGRGLDEDLAYFLGCAAAGRHAATLLHAGD
ncbi:MAG TPA: DUF3866 family protein [Mycobacteriales bacterium]|nr:DUF3866 family protein [Mycobacteriales bacterium]